MNIIETIERGSDNFKVVEVPALKIKVGMVVLPRFTEIDMISRARAWCKNHEPVIDDADLIKVQEDAFLLWKSLVHPDQPWTDVSEGRIPNLLFDSMQDMERTLTGDWQDWMSEALLKFREEVSPLSSAHSLSVLEDLLEQIRTENQKPERFIQAFCVTYCTRLGMLPTERRVKETTDEQWWLIWYSLPDEEKASFLKSPLFIKAREVDG